MKIKQETIITKSEDLLEAPLDESLALMSIDSGKYYGLNPIGRDIWEKIAKPSTFEEIINYLQNRFEIDQKTCEEETLSFLLELANRQMIELK